MTNQTFHPQPWLALLVVGLIAWGAAGLRAEGTPPPEYLLQARELVRSFAAAQDGLAWLEQHRSQLTAENVANVDEVTRVALQIGNLNLASAAAQLVSLAKLAAGDRRGSLAAQVRKLEIELQLASTTQAYQEVRVAARGTASMAASINAADLEFRLLTIAADAGYFADQPCRALDPRATGAAAANQGASGRCPDPSRFPGNAEGQAAVLQDLTSAAHLARDEPDQRWRERFVSLTSAVVAEALTHFGYGGEESRRRELLRNLASAVELAIPKDFRYHQFAGKTWRDSIQTQSWLAELSYQFGQPETGSTRLLHGARDARARSEHEQWARLSFQRYRSERDIGRTPAELVAERDELIGMAEAFRERYRSRAGRLWAASSADRRYTDLVTDQLTLQDRNLDRIFQQVEGLKTRFLLDQLLIPFQPLRDPTTVSRAADLEHQIIGFPKCLKNHDDLLMREMLLASRQPIANPLPDDDQKAEYVQELEALYAGEQAGFAGVAPLPHIGDIRAALATDEALIEYFIPYHPLHPTVDVWIFIVTRDRVALERVPRALLDRGHRRDILQEQIRAAGQKIDVFLADVTGGIGSMWIDECPPVDSSPIVDEIASLRDNLRSGEAAALAQLKAFHQLLIEPVIRAGFDPEKFARWIVVPHGPLHYIPFAALADERGRFLIQRVAIALSPSAAVWLHEQQRAWQPPRRILGLMSPTLTDPSLPTLPPVMGEDEKLRAMLRDTHVDLLSGTEATEHGLKERASQAELIHFSTHGRFPERDAIDFHEVLLSPDGTDDGRLQAHEIRTLDLSETALVVLKICNGGLYNVGPSDEPYGLIPSFLAAGAGGVVGTLWEVEDAFGSDFITRFYAHLQQDGPALALKRAMEAFIDEEEDIRRWASFVAVGPGRPFREISPPAASR